MRVPITFRPKKVEPNKALRTFRVTLNGRIVGHSQSYDETVIIHTYDHSVVDDVIKDTFDLIHGVPKVEEITEA